jgi:GNAT superfamily N-acetyltransferase
MLSIRALTNSDQDWLQARAADVFNGEIIVSKGVAHTISKLPGFIAEDAGVAVGIAVYSLQNQCELVSISAFIQWRGVGSALIAAVEQAARDAGLSRIWLVTTNDNVDAMRFYQKRGYRMKAVYPSALTQSRKLKPQIPLTGNYGITMSDEIEFEKTL